MMSSYNRHDQGHPVLNTVIMTQHIYRFPSNVSTQEKDKFPEVFQKLSDIFQLRHITVKSRSDLYEHP